MSKIRAKQISIDADLSMGSHKLTNVTNPTSAQDAATKNYVDTVAAGLSWKQAVRVATTANGTLSTAFSNGQTVDGVTLVTGDRILLKNQSTGSQNGIYTVNSSGAPTRATDADTAPELLSASAFVEEGSTNAGTAWVQTATSITVGTTALVFVKFTNSTAATTPSKDDKQLTPGTASSDNSDTTLTISNTPSGYVGVSVNGVAARVGDGVKTKDCYFTNDAGSTARAFGAIASGDALYWNGTIAGFGLDSSDNVDLFYND